jgi:hypothetical protein
MNVYLDDDSVDGVLVRLLRADGHDVLRPMDVGLIGEPDPVHFRRAIKSGRTLLTHNHDDFADLHELVIDSGGHHPGVLVVRRGNDPRKDLTSRGIVSALRKLLQAAAPIPDSLHILNQWR